MSGREPAQGARAVPTNHALQVTALVVLLLVAVVAGERLIHAVRAPAADRAIDVLPVIRSAGSVDRAQRASDLVGAPPGADFVRASVRRLTVVPEFGAVVSVATDIHGNTCLVATDPDRSGYRAACATAATAAASGVELVWSADALPQPGTGGEARSYLPRLVIANLGPDGRLRLDSQVPRPQNSTPYPNRPSFGALGDPEGQGGMAPHRSADDVGDTRLELMTSSV